MNEEIIVRVKSQNCALSRWWSKTALHGLYKIGVVKRWSSPTFSDNSYSCAPANPNGKPQCNRMLLAVLSDAYENHLHSLPESPTSVTARNLTVPALSIGSRPFSVRFSSVSVAPSATRKKRTSRTLASRMIVAPLPIIVMSPVMIGEGVYIQAIAVICCAEVIGAVFKADGVKRTSIVSYIGGNN